MSKNTTSLECILMGLKGYCTSLLPHKNKDKLYQASTRSVSGIMTKIKADSVNNHNENAIFELLC